MRSNEVKAKKNLKLCLTGESPARGKGYHSTSSVRVRKEIILINAYYG